MSPEKQRIAIAKVCGWELEPASIENGHPCFDNWVKGDEAMLCLPDYLNDLNAMHEAEKVLTHEEKTDYIRILNKMDFAYRRLAFATAAQRAEAFLKTLNLWEEE